MLLLGSWLDGELAMSRGHLVKVKDISVRVRDHCHEAAPWLPRGRHREVHAQTSQTRVLSLKIGDFEAHTCVTPHQFSMICPWQRDPESNATCREGRVAMFRRRELEG